MVLGNLGAPPVDERVKVVGVEDGGKTVIVQVGIHTVQRSIMKVGIASYIYDEQVK